MENNKDKWKSRKFLAFCLQDPLGPVTEVEGAILAQGFTGMRGIKFQRAYKPHNEVLLPEDYAILHHVFDWERGIRRIIVWSDSFPAVPIGGVIENVFEMSNATESSACIKRISNRVLQNNR